MEAKKFYICEHCGNIVEVVDGKPVPVKCCGQNMTEIKPGEIEASTEKHIPVVKVDGDVVEVTVGSVEHPMLDAHHIAWISVETDRGVQRKYLLPGEKPFAKFNLAGDKLVNVYAYCNLHGLWKADI